MTSYTDVELSAAEFVLAHGWSDSDACKAFRIEGLRDAEEPDVLMEYDDAELRQTPTFFPATGEKFYHRFRLVMTAQTATGTWFLMVSWFDVFGTIRARLSF